MLDLGLLVVATMTATSLMLAAQPAHAATTFIVNDNGDQSDTNPGDGFCNAVISPPVQGCTLRAAIQEANATAGADQINFSLPFTTIAPSSPLPAIRNQTTIDGYTQPGSSPNTLAEGDNAAIGVQLDGSFAGNSSGLVFAQSASGDNFSNSVVQGLAVNNFSRDGITVFGGLGVRINGNFIGTDSDGTGNLTNDDMGNDGAGVSISQSQDNTIGSSEAGQGNVISSNDFGGVFIGRSTGDKLLGNRIGTDRTGTQDLGNAFTGVSVSDASNTTIGDGTVGGANTIAFSGRGADQRGWRRHTQQHQRQQRLPQLDLLQRR